MRVSFFTEFCRLTFKMGGTPRRGEPSSLGDTVMRKLIVILNRLLKNPHFAFVS